MSTTPRTLEELMEIGKNEAQARQPTLTDFTEGSTNDTFVGTAATLVEELNQLLLDRFKTTFFSSAEGDDLENLAVDHFGDTFARPDAQEAVGIVTFTRANASAGDVVIGTSVIVKTEPDANGDAQRFQVISEVTMTGLTINASVEAVEAGLAGNVGANTVTVIETALTDPSVEVDNAADFSGGAEEEEDAVYRETILYKIQELKGATLEAVQAAALNVSGIEYATATEFLLTAREWDESGAVAIGDVFRLPRVKLYVADANGVANDALIELVEAAILEVRACGVLIDVFSGTGSSMNWTAVLTLNPGGPNYATLSVDPQPIIDDMTDYIQDLPIGDDFYRALGRAYILGLWGSAGTNDLTDFQTTTPSGDVSTTADEKLIPGTITTS